MRRYVWISFVVVVAIMASVVVMASAANAETLVAAGDIAFTTGNGDRDTATLITGIPGSTTVPGIPGTVAPLGDNEYEFGTLLEYNLGYAPTWGAFKNRTMPTIGNHEILLGSNPAGYRGYFGDSVVRGPENNYYYSYDLGSWHVVVLNSNCGNSWPTPNIVSCASNGQQANWLRNDLMLHPNKCTVAMMHHPPYGSGGETAATRPLAQILYDGGVDVLLAGHAHHYERLARINGAGALDPTHGFREFVVGTGGRSHDDFPTPIASSVVRDNTSYGVLKLSLNAGSYDWQFIPVGIIPGVGPGPNGPQTFTDSGSDTCS
jgi:acid phosphatase type 7